MSGDGEMVRATNAAAGTRQAVQSLEELLQHPRLWRARGQSRDAGTATLATGFPLLDARLPGGGWPAHGLVELLVDADGIGELSLMMPVLARCLDADPGAWTAWITPPHEPYAPALVTQGIDPRRLLVVRTTRVPWAMEQTLRSRVCAVVIGWLGKVTLQGLRRLKLATEHSRALGFIIRSVRHRNEAVPAELRLVLAPARTGLEVELLKCRGGSPATFTVPFGAGWIV
jgi:hypothetical protein